MSVEEVARVHFFPRQFLRARDFEDEQAYHMAMRRRHNIANHSWGILDGMELVVDEVDGRPYLQPGIAVDGYGREIVVPERMPISPELFADRGTAVLDVWVTYGRATGEQAPTGFARCEEEEDSFYRWVERPLLRFEAGEDGDDSDRRRPPGLSPGDDPFPASRTPPDEGEWRVFLGQLRVDRTDPKKPVYSTDLDGRPFADLIGARIEAPSGRALIQIGAERKDDSYRFAVFVPEAEDPDDDPLPPRLFIDKEGDTGFRGDVEVAGDLIIRERALEFPVGTARRDDTTPWRIYHHRTDSDRHTLRLQFERGADGQRGRNRLAVGSWAKPPSGEGPEGFQPCLVVDDDCNVTINGNLVVQGKLETRETVAAQLTDEARRFAVGAYLSGVGTTGAAIERFPFLSGPQTIVEELGGEVQLRMLAASLESDLDRAQEFVEIVRSEHPRLARTLGLEPLEDREPTGAGQGGSGPDQEEAEE